ncbi:MAG TPA: D-sedoheptulose 7-phosphate isomerase [Candidatus Saccharimonadales bacterium]|nr:D-sedoheptulose 7-phosphate isomerase [Candidatus Saccharimonadales bacterium]
MLKHASFADQAEPIDTSQSTIVRSIQESLDLKQALLADRHLLNCISRVGREISAALERGNKVFFFGNGGSAADAQHLAAELVGRFERDRHAWPGIALAGNVSTLTSIANDYSYELVFARQLEGLAQSGDIAVGLSTSGKSANVLCALKSAKKGGLVSVGMTGKHSPEMAAIVDYCISVPSTRTARIQEAHILIGHVLCEIVDQMQP